MADITSINQKHMFGFAEAQRLLPVVRRITQEAVVRSEALALRYEALPEAHPSRGELERELNDLILGWAAKIQKLGAEAKGLWLVDFEGDEGRWGWRFGENELAPL
jgi:hypothetical protein